MGWFDEQLRQRKKNDDEIFEQTFASISDAVTGEKISASFRSDKSKTEKAIGEILAYYGVKPKEIPDNISDTNEQLEYLMRPQGIMYRNVKLGKKWYKDAIGAMLGINKSDGAVVALIPSGLHGYKYLDRETGKYIKINGKNIGLFEDVAIAFYKPFPLKKLTAKDLLKYILGTLSATDIVFFVLSALVVAVIGLVTPKFSSLITGTVADSGSISLLVSAVVFMICAVIASALIDTLKSFLIARINTKMEISVQAATMARILSLPAGFFKEYSSGDLASRADNINRVCQIITSSVLSAGFTSLFSLIYISQIFIYTPSLALPAIIIILVDILFTVVTVIVSMRVNKKYFETAAAEQGMSYEILRGIQKVKLAGAEKRIFAKWGKLYSKEAALIYNPPVFIKYNKAFSTAISLIGTIIFYALAIKNGISVSDFYAFSVALGMISGAFTALSDASKDMAEIKPIIELSKPILETVPEIHEEKQVISRLSGGVELTNVSFRYNENMPYILNDFSLKIRPGQYVAIVGETGCGKSTLMRILLGFETPQKGAVYYDGKDLARIDLKSLRRKIGVVMQDGKLFAGDIYSNIVVSAPWLTMEDAWKAAELAGIADDIRRMPMGMHTMVSEGGGGISGGQRQRLMIARAVAGSPKILMFDEATSALDNIAQKNVSQSLDGLKCTRIVIAHRLSTIKQCNRIIYLEKGKIAEDGTYDQLMALNGKFARLVERQRVDKN